MKLYSSIVEFLFIANGFTFGETEKRVLEKIRPLIENYEQSVKARQLQQIRASASSRRRNPPVQENSQLTQQHLDDILLGIQEAVAKLNASTQPACNSDECEATPLPVQVLQLSIQADSRHHLNDVRIEIRSLDTPFNNV